MPPKRTRKRAGRAQGSGDSGVGMVDHLQEQKNEKIRLFMQDFAQQKKEHMMEVKKELEVLCALPDQVLELELLKMPMSIRQMKVSDYNKMMEESKKEAVLEKVDSLEEELAEVKLLRKGSKRVKVTDSSAPKASTSQKSNTVQKVSKSKSLVSLTTESGKRPILTRSTSATPLNKAPKKGCASASYTRTTSQTRLMAASSTRSSRNKGFPSLSDQQPLREGFPLLHIPLVDGQTLSSAVADLDSLDVELLRQDTVQHIHTLVGQLTNLCAKASSQQTNQSPSG